MIGLVKKQKNIYEPEWGGETAGCGQICSSWLINEIFLNFNLSHDKIDCGYLINSYGSISMDVCTRQWRLGGVF